MDCCCCCWILEAPLRSVQSLSSNSKQSKSKTQNSQSTNLSLAQCRASATPIRTKLLSLYQFVQALYKCAASELMHNVFTRGSNSSQNAPNTASNVVTEPFHTQALLDLLAGILDFAAKPQKQCNMQRDQRPIRNPCTVQFVGTAGTAASLLCCTPETWQVPWSVINLTVALYVCGSAAKFKFV
jgi:hypothetical protein